MTMNRLDARARLVFHYAREEADRLGHAVIESEHLLLGLLREGGTAAQVLNASGLTLEAARHRVVELIGRFDRSRDAPPPAITALARRVMDLAGVEAANYQSSFINTGFVLLGMIHAGDGVAMGIINQTAGGTKAVRRATLAALNLPPDAILDTEESSPNSSLSGIVAVPADSVLARLFNRPPEQNLEPSLPVQAIPEIPVQAPVQPMFEIPAQPISEIPAMSLGSQLLEPQYSQTKISDLEPIQHAPEMSAQHEPREEEIPDSMLIDEAFEEVPPELELAIPMIESVASISVVESVAQLPVVETMTQTPMLEKIASIAEFEPADSIPESEPLHPILEFEDEVSVPDSENLSPVRHPTPVIEFETVDLPKTLTETSTSQGIPDSDEPSAKVTAEVLVAEVEVMPEAILSPERPDVEPSPNDSTEGLLISDLLETPFDQATNLVSYQTPALAVLAQPQANLEIPINEDFNQTIDFTNLAPEMIEENKSTLVLPEIENSVETTQPEFSVQPEIIEFIQVPEIVQPEPFDQNLEPKASSMGESMDFEISTEIPLEPPTLHELMETIEETAPILTNDLTLKPVLEENILSLSAASNTLPFVPPTLLKVASWDMVTASSVIKRQIIALGGGGFSQESSNSLLDQYILEVASSAREVAVPRVCFVSTAAGDSDVYIKRFYKAFEQLNCQASHLPLFHTEDWAEDLEDMILSADVLYFSGGSTKNALALWQAWELEPIFKQAYEAGTVFTGVSAGAICWFEQFTTDSMGRSLGVMNGLGWLPGSFTPHYDSERFRKPTLEKFLRAQKISPGFAADDHAAVHFVNGEYIGAVASTPTAKAYHVTLGRNRLVESPLETRFLGEVSGS